MSDKRRESGIELLRILGVMGVVIMHYNNASMGGGFLYVKENSINQYIMYFFESVFECSVNVFVLISGYFLCNIQKRQMIKVVELLFQVILFKEAFYLVAILTKWSPASISGLLGAFIPNNWFVILYITLYILSPYINFVVCKLNKRALSKLVLTLMILFSFWTILEEMLENIMGYSINGLSTIGLEGSESGYTIVNFILLYIVGAYLRLNEINIKSNLKLMLGLVCETVIMFVWQIIEHKMGFGSITAWNYNNPLLIIMAANYFLIFKNIKIYSRLVNEFAAASFTCYLFHDSFLKYVGVEKMVTGSWYKMVLHQVGVVLILYVLSYIVYKIYVLCTGWFFDLIKPSVNKINIEIND